MGKKSNNWVENVLLPDLFAKYQARDKRYQSIIISDKQAACISDITVQKSIGGGLLGGRTVFYRVGHWEFREIQLKARGRYHFLSFGMTTEEQEKDAKEAEKSEFQREKEMAERVTARKNNGENIRAWEAMVTKYQADVANRKVQIADYEATEPDNPFLSYIYKQLEKSQEILKSLEK